MRLTGHNIADLLRTEITGPLEIKDVYLGLPENEYQRFCPIAVLDETTRERAMFSDFINSYEGIKMPLSWVAGVANAWDLAYLFNIFAFEGTFGGRTFFSKETQALISVPTNKPGEIDRVLRWPVSWGLGVILGDTPSIYGTPPHPRAIGHAGGGANVVWADPDERLAVAFLCNGMRTGGTDWERYRVIGDLIYASLLPKSM
jgi:CubicO group peptidase (beta-lactamase class C family)